MALSMSRSVGTEVMRRNSPLVAVVYKALMEVVRLEVRSSVLLTPLDSRVSHFAVVGPVTLVKDLRTLAPVQRHYLLVIANWD